MGIKNVFRVVFITLLILLIPFVAMQFSDEVGWDLSDFVVMGVMLFVVGLLIDLVARKTWKYKAVLIGLIAFLFLWLWAELAVGIFGTPFAGS